MAPHGVAAVMTAVTPPAPGTVRLYDSDTPWIRGAEMSVTEILRDFNGRDEGELTEGVMSGVWCSFRI